MGRFCESGLAGARLFMLTFHWLTLSHLVTPNCWSLETLFNCIFLTSITSLPLQRGKSFGRSIDNLYRFLLALCVLLPMKIHSMQ